MTAQTRKIVYDFRGHCKYPAVAAGVGSAFISKATGSATILGVSGGGVALAMDATSEVQNACLYMGDILPFGIADLVRVEFIAKVSASLAAAVTAAFGVGTARNDATDSIADNAMFKLAGSNAVVCETDDGTTDTDDVATGETLTATFKRFAIDFSEGGLTQSPPSLSLGSKADVRFFAGNANGSLRRVAQNQRFNMSASTANLQLFAQIQKTTGTATGTLTILEASVEYRLPC